MNQPTGILACVVVAGLTTAQASGRLTAAPDPITAWSEAAAVTAQTGGMAPLRLPITLAILHLAMYDAVANATTQEPPYAVTLDLDRSASAYAAAVEAGYRVLEAEFGVERGALHATYETLLAGEPDSSQKRAGMTIGAEVARQLLASRAADRRNERCDFAVTAAVGAWSPTPPQFHPATTGFLGKVTPFTLSGPSQFRPAGPPPFSSAQWQAEYDEVKSLGARDSRSRTPEQTATAWFWEPLAGTVWPATVHRIARERALDLRTSARFQAMSFAAYADALIACWDAKFHFNFWRPITAIRNGDRDGHPLTAPDPGWEPLAPTPSFPEYPSGHACVTAAVAHTIENFFDGTATISARHQASGQERSYRRASEVVDEVVAARMLIGVHFRSANEAGAEIGRQIAAQIRRDGLRRRR